MNHNDAKYARLEFWHSHRSWQGIQNTWFSFVSGMDKHVQLVTRFLSKSIGRTPYQRNQRDNRTPTPALTKLFWDSQLSFPAQIVQPASSESSQELHTWSFLSRQTAVLDKPMQTKMENAVQKEATKLPKVNATKQCDNNVNKTSKWDQWTRHEMCSDCNAL